MFISEIYACVQGEGRLAGTPSVLVRTSGCNLRCKWGKTLCDTPFTSWKPEGTEMLVDDVFKAVLKHAHSSYEEYTRLAVKDKPTGPFTPYPITHVIISGGEPTLQKDLPELCRKLKHRGYHITVETNGTNFFLAPVDLVSISPKHKNSIPVGTKFESMHTKNLESLSSTLLDLLTCYDSYLKFVIVSEADMPEVVYRVSILALDPSRVYLMPEGATRKEIDKRRRLVMELAQKRGFRFSPRLHIDAYDSKRGV